MRSAYPRVAAALAVLVAFLSPAFFAPPAQAATGSVALISGSGSSWAGNALTQWVSDVASQGVQVVYTPDGDAQGRQDFANRTSDFAVTSEGYQGVDPVTGVSDTSQNRPYAYLPIAAGGTSFPYHLVIDGHQIENLRLSGETLVKIFTNQITNWDDPEITADNNGVALPSLAITPVVQSEGSGSTAQLTTYFAAEFPAIWQAYAHLNTWTEYYPRQGNQIAQNGSNSAMNYVASRAANGSIGYVEYSYPLLVGYPVAKVLNSAGYYTLPTQYNVAVALEKAQINMDKSSPDYLLQNLTNVYTDPDPRTYPLSSYVYMIEPTGTYHKDSGPETKITNAKRQAIADFADYAICQGQGEIGPLGYSSLPINLVEAAFGQIEKLQQAAPTIDLDQLNITTCANPTFVEGHPDANYLAEIAPTPPSCDARGAGPCAAGVTPNGTGPTPGSSSSPGAGGRASGPSKSASPGGSITSGSASSKAATAKPSGGPGGAKPTSPTGPIGISTSGRPSSPSTTAPPKLVSASLPGFRPGDGGPSLMQWLIPLVAALLLVVFAIPTVIGYRRARGRHEGQP